MPGWLAPVLSVVTWVGLGAAAAFFLHARRGRSSGLWFVISIILGPFAWLVGWDRSEQHTTAVVERVPGDTEAGIRVLAGVDGSAESASAVAGALELLGDRVGSLLLVHVLDYDQEEIDRDSALRQGHNIVEAAASQLPSDSPRPSTEVAVGRAADALLELASREGADLLVLGHRGRGLRKAVVGSVCDEVARRSSIPVLVGGDPQPAGS